jgi:SAM-dependent methyltransferase
MNCRNCETQIREFFNLGQMPLVNSYLKKEDIKDEFKYELAVGFCSKCYLTQLIHTIDPAKIFCHYLYFSSVSKSFVNHCRENALFFQDKLGLDDKSLVVEIASNDGAQLQAFKDLGIRTLGIDPAKNIAEVANQRGIKTLPEFFNEKLAKKLAEDESNCADLIYGANVLAHVPEIKDFVAGVKTLLKPGGTASFEFPYLRGLFEKKFDTIYDEHVFYLGVLALDNLFATADLELYDVDITQVQGGSLRLLIGHTGQHEITQKLIDLRNEEKTLGYDKIESYKKIAIDVEGLKNELITKLDSIKSQGKSIAAYSAPAKGNVLLNYFGIGKNYLDFVVDITPAKQGLYTPGTHLEIFPVDKIEREKPDYLLVLCWNLADEITGQLSDYRRRGGKLIIPVPEIRVID